MTPLLSLAPVHSEKAKEALQYAVQVVTQPSPTPHASASSSLLTILLKSKSASQQMSAAVVSLTQTD